MPQRASVTPHVPGVHVIAMALAVAVPEHVCGPPSAIFPSFVTDPVKPLNGAANESEQSVCVTMTLCPTNDGSQWAVIFHAPATSGHAPLPEDVELELLHAATRRTVIAKRRSIRPCYATASSRGG
jgi:hypothetical protein